MNKLWRLVWIVLAGAWAAGAAVAADVRHADLLAHGDSQHFWIADVHPAPTLRPATQTTIYYRAEGQDNRWQVLGQLPDRVVALASQGGQAAALLDDGTIDLLYTDGTTVTVDAPPLPARVVALAGGRQTWWTVAVVPGGIGALGSHPSAASAPSTSAAAAASAETHPAAAGDGRPAIAAVTPRLVMFMLEGGRWTPVAELPDEIVAAPSVSVAVIDEVPYVALLDLQGRPRVRHLAGGRWTTDAGPADASGIAGFKLLGDPTLPRLWVERTAGPDLLYVFAPGKPSPLELRPVPGAAPEQRAVAVAIGKLRMIARTPEGKLLEQDYDRETAVPGSAPSALALPRASPLGYLPNLQSFLVTVALVVAIFGSFRRRPAMRALAERVDRVPLAPLGRRLAAGLIDALPVIVALGIMGGRTYAAAHSPDQPDVTVELFLVYWAAALFYVIYTTLIESLAGRTPGKMAMGLRVIDLDGRPAPRGALVTRNMLRIIDVGIFFIPLLLVPMFPLRQRVGDVAAGTLVVYGEGTEPVEANAEGTASEGQGAAQVTDAAAGGSGGA